MDEDNYVFFVGRADDVIISAGWILHLFWPSRYILLYLISSFYGVIKYIVSSSYPLKLFDLKNKQNKGRLKEVLSDKSFDFILCAK